MRLSFGGRPNARRYVWFISAVMRTAFTNDSLRPQAHYKSEHRIDRPRICRGDAEMALSGRGRRMRSFVPITPALDHPARWVTGPEKVISIGRAAPRMWR